MRGRPILLVLVFFLGVWIVKWKSGHQQKGDRQKYLPKAIPERYEYKADFNRSSETEQEHLNKSETQMRKTSLEEAFPGCGKSHNGPFRDLKTILYYTGFYKAGRQWPFGLGREPFKEHRCPVDKCYLTDDRSLHGGSVRHFDALMFNLWPRNLLVFGGDRSFLGFDMPEERCPHQRYVLQMSDPAAYSASSNHTTPETMNGLFNWTMSYRLDSNFPRTTGWLEEYGKERRKTLPKATDPPRVWIQYNETEVKEKVRKGKDTLMPLLKRPRQVAWTVSHCNTSSAREDYVAELKKHIDVEVYGLCGKSCGGRKAGNNCSEVVIREFKFYLSFENSLCDFYVSEKFWKAMSWNVIPIVMGRGFYTNLAPPHSYIDVEDFESPEHLAKYLKRLSEDPEEYLAYFWWKDLYYVSRGPEQSWLTWCELCRRLHEDQEMSVFEDFEEMARCVEPTKWKKEAELADPR